ASVPIVDYTAYVRNRATNTTETIPGLPVEFTEFPGIANAKVSRDGCHVAFWGRDYYDYAAGRWNIYSWNRCANGGAAIVGFNVDPNPNDFPGPLDVSADGRYVAYVATPAGGPHIARIDTVAATESVLPINPGYTGADSISISDDGKFVAVGEQRAAGFVPAAYQVVGWKPPCAATCTTEVVSLGSTGQPLSGFNDFPSVSADGRYVAWVSDTSDILGSPSPSNQVYVRDRVGGVTKLVTDTPGKPMIPTGIGVGEPDISPDGTQIALTEEDQFETSEVWVAHTTSGYFDTASFDLVSVGVSGAPISGGAGAGEPSMSSTGRFVAFSSSANDQLSGGTVPLGATQVWLRTRPIQLGSTPTLSFGTVDVGSQSPPQNAVITNTSLAEVNLGAVSPPGGPFAITANTCAGVLPAGASCAVTLVFKPTSAGPASSSVGVTGEGLSVTTSLTGTGRTPTSTTTTTTVPTAGSLKVKPTSANFGSAPVGTSLPSKKFVVTNPGQTAVTITNVALGGDGQDQFAVPTNGCTGALAPAASCTIEVSATVTREGLLTATLTVQASGGQSATATLRLGGEFSPTLKMNPGVVAAGEITLAIGADFPPNTDVQLSFSGETPFATVHTVDGTFSYPYLVLRNGVRIGGRQVIAVDVQQPSLNVLPAPLLIGLATYRPSGITNPAITSGVRALVTRGG
ncbi:MAG: choice-of-anchor D domain-containing protein, partial [Ilumatobacteraceae bacterium]